MVSGCSGLDFSARFAKFSLDAHGGFGRMRPTRKRVRQRACGRRLRLVFAVRITSVTAPKRVDKLRRFSRIRLPRRALARPLDPWIDGRDSKRDAPRFRLRLEEKRSRSLTIDQVIHVGACR